MAAGLLSLGLTGCGSTAEVQLVPRAEATHAHLTDDTETPEPSESPDAEQDSSGQSEVEQSDAEQRAALDRYVEAARTQIPAMLEANKESFADLRIESRSLDSTTCTMVVAGQTDPAAARGILDAMAPTLQTSFDTLTIPAMRAFGVQGTVHVTYVFVNADGSTIMEKTFTSSD